MALVDRGETEGAPVHVHVGAGDTIVWRSDAVHVGVPPGNATSHFGAVGYFAMEEAGLTPRKSTVDVGR